jgi:hypothetical protein
LKTSRGVLEISLTPTNRDWDEVLDYRIRFHGTPKHEKDIESNVLPPIVKDQMIANIGDHHTATLLYFNFVREIGIENLRAAIGGPLDNAGIPAFALIP